MVDVTEASSLQNAARDFVERFGIPDIVIANAGVSVGTASGLPKDLAIFRRVMDTNVFGMAATFQPFIAPMRERASGTLAGISSVAGFRGLPGAAAYSASKSAVISYLESLRQELRGSGVKVVTICPGYIRTQMTEVNPYPMPFLMEADKAARKMAQFIKAKKRFVIMPWQMALIGRLMKLLPNWLFDLAFAKVKHKPRGMLH